MYEDMFTQDEVAEKFRRDQAAQIKYVKEECIKAMVITLKELNVDKATTEDKLMVRFGLQPKVAQGYVEANW